MISVHAVSNAKDMTEFLRVPNAVYKSDPYYVFQLEFERRLHLSPKNPYFKHAKAQYFVAFENDLPVGRISAQIDSLAQKNSDDPIGHFGFLDAVNENVAGQLLSAAETWLRSQGARKVIGPYSLSINDESGLLIEGFGSSPHVMMNYAPEWMSAAIEKCGYKKAKDLIAFQLNANENYPPVAARMSEKSSAVSGMVERALNPKKMKQDLQAILGIFNDAWSENWGFVPMTDEEISYAAMNMKPFIQPELARIIEVDGKPVAMIVALPDLNEALAGMRGKLLPFGWAHILWRLKIKKLSKARVLLMGVRREYQASFTGSAFAALLIRNLQLAMRRLGYVEAELSWILEDNLPMLRLIESIGGKPYKKYRLYEKILG